MPPLRPIPKVSLFFPPWSQAFIGFQEETHLAGYNTWYYPPNISSTTHYWSKRIRFFDDIDLLRQRWHSENNETVAELWVNCVGVVGRILNCFCRLIDFFRYYSRDFSYNTGVASIRSGLLKKDSKGWQNDVCLSVLQGLRVLRDE
jgi:DNA polymerase sigma